MTNYFGKVCCDVMHRKMWLYRSRTVLTNHKSVRSEFVANILNGGSSFQYIRAGALGFVFAE